MVTGTTNPNESNTRLKEKTAAIDTSTRPASAVISVRRDEVEAKCCFGHRSTTYGWSTRGSCIRTLWAAAPKARQKRGENRERMALEFQESHRRCTPLFHGFYPRGAEWISHSEKGIRHDTAIRRLDHTS